MRVDPLGRAELIVALDLPSAEEASAMADRLAGEVDFFKVGLELFIAAGPDVVDALKAKNARVFLDLKLHDIPNQVANAVLAAGLLGADLLTVHTLGGREMMTAAADAARGVTKLIGVTILTSHDDRALREIGIEAPVKDGVSRLARLAMESGLDGVVSSVEESASLRDETGPDFLIVTPGIRPAGAEVGDQKRAMTPADAVASGSDYLVVGRPIIGAADPAVAARAIREEMVAEARE